MKVTMSAADANRRFSEVLRTVTNGHSVVVTSHGKPVAKVIPITADEGLAEAARAALFARLRKARPSAVGRWTRAELYEDAE